MVSRRLKLMVLAGAAALLAGGSAAQMQPIRAGAVMEAVERLRPGQYLWMPGVAPEGPMLVVINIATQRLVAYRNGVPIAVSTVSTGKRGHRTPTGVFTILQKKAFHRSNKYSNAPMPFMQRLTWQGVALHGGHLPGYPASHGCIRLPHHFAKLLFRETALGMTVVVVNQPDALHVAPTPASLRTRTPAGPAMGPAWWRPDLAPDGPVSIVVSGADRRIAVLRNGVQIGSAPVAFQGEIDRPQAYMLERVTGGSVWKRIALPGDSTAKALPAAAATAARTIDAGRPFERGMASVLGPGATMIVVPDSLSEGIGAAPPPAWIPADLRVIAQWKADGRVTGGR